MSVSSGFVVHTGGHVLGVTALQPFGCLVVHAAAKGRLGVLVALCLCNVWSMVRSINVQDFLELGGVR